MLGMYFVQMIIADGRPGLGAVISLVGTVCSTVLNAVFLIGLDMGIYGLALATGIGNTIPALFGAIYFIVNRKLRKGTLYFVKPKWDIRAIGRASFNGVSEMVTMAATTVTTVVMNNVLVNMEGVGEIGIAAASIVMGITAIFSSLYFGYSAGVAPLISYNFGKERKDRLYSLYKKSKGILLVLSTIAVIGTLIFADALVRIYVSPGYCEWTGVNLHAMAVRGLRIATIGYIFMAFNVFATAMFTAFNDGIVSGFMSFMRTLVLATGLLILLPGVWDLNGVWVALPFAEVLSIGITIFFFIKMGKKYGYRDQAKTKWL
jgi:Na+-driven multidrug efflux pump